MGGNQHQYQLQQQLANKRFDLIKTLIQWAHLCVACDEWADFRGILERLKGVRVSLSGKAQDDLKEFYSLIHKNGNMKWGLEGYESNHELFSKRVEALISSAQYLPRE